MNNTTVSVIIPTYNRESLIGRAIKSVLNQTYQEFEIIIVDDGSTDNTREMVKEFQKRDKRIKYFKHEINKGGGATRNTGIKSSKGEYIAFLDSDDEWLPEKLAKQVRKLTDSSNKVALIYTGESVIDSETGRCLKKKLSTIEGYVFDRLLEGDFIGSCSSVVVNKNIIEAVGGFDEHLVSRQDWDCWLRMTQEYKIGCVAEIMVLRYIGQYRISRKLIRIAEGTKRVIEKHRHDMRRRPKVYGKLLAMLASMELNLSRRDGWKTAWKAVRVYPLQPKLYLALLVSVLGKRVYHRVYFSWKKGRKEIYIGDAQL